MIEGFLDSAFKRSATSKESKYRDWSLWSLLGLTNQSVDPGQTYLVTGVSRVIYIYSIYVLGLYRDNEKEMETTSISILQVPVPMHLPKTRKNVVFLFFLLSTSSFKFFKLHTRLDTGGNVLMLTPGHSELAADVFKSGPCINTLN